MAPHNIQNQEMSLLLTSDAKPRLKWTPELHQRFVDAVDHLGGPEKATPKSLMRLMEIHGLTLYHLKSHLQKYRLGKIQRSATDSQNMQENDADFACNTRSDLTGTDDNEDGNPNQIEESLKIAQALQMQMEVQRKLHEQIKVQRHLQVRIEAQGRYLQSVLRRAQETLAGYNSLGVEIAKTELSHLVSMVDNGCSSSLAELEHPLLEKDMENKRMKIAMGSSLESSLTSLESFGRNENDCVVLSLMEMNHEDKSGVSKNGSGRKRSESTISDSSDCVDFNPQGKRSRKGIKGFDLNSQCVNDFD